MFCHFFDDCLTKICTVRGGCGRRCRQHFNSSQTCSTSYIRANGWPGQGVDVSDLGFILHDYGDTRTDTVLHQHNP